MTTTQPIIDLFSFLQPVRKALLYSLMYWKAPCFCSVTTCWVLFSWANRVHRHPKQRMQNRYAKRWDVVMLHMHDAVQAEPGATHMIHHRLSLSG